MENTKIPNDGEMDIDVIIYLLTEKELLSEIKDAYEEVDTTSKVKKAEREKYTNLFVEKYAQMYSVPKERVRSIVDIVIARTRWIREIEELEEELEGEFEQE